MITIPKGEGFEPSFDYIWGEWNGAIRLETFEILKKENIRTIWDIGANVGVFSDICLREFPDAIVYAIEPDARNMEILKSNLDKNQHIFFHQCGIYYGVTEGHPMNVIDDDNKAGYIFSAVEREHLGHCLDNTVTHTNTVFHMKTLEDLFWIPADLVKIDIEGSEYNVIEHSTILKECRFLILEFHNHVIGYIDGFLTKHLPMYDRIFVTNEHYGSPVHFYVFLRKTE